MDVPEPDQSPFTAVTAHTSKLTRVSFSRILRFLRIPEVSLIPFLDVLELVLNEY